MKRAIALLLLFFLIVGLTACELGGVPNVTIEALTAANSEAALLAAHESWLNTYRAEFAQSDNSFVTKEGTFAEFPQNGFSVLTVDGEEWYYIDNYEGGEPVFYHWFAMTDAEREEYAFRTGDYRNILDQTTTLQETIRECRSNGDGTLTVTTEVDAASWLGDGDRSLFPDELWNADCIRCVYLADRKTLAVRSSRAYYVKGEKETLIGSIGVVYDAPMPEKMAKMLKTVEAYKNAAPNEKFLLTVVYNAGTPAEERFSTTLVKNAPITLQARKDHALYSDPERTLRFTGKFPKDGGDVTLYAFPK